MSNFSTELESALFKNQSIKEVIRVELELAVNELLKLKLIDFRYYKKCDQIGYNSYKS